jgi:hypothetical protein
MAQVPDVDMPTAAMHRELPSAPGLTDDIDGLPPHHARRTPPMRAGCDRQESQPEAAPDRRRDRRSQTGQRTMRTAITAVGGVTLRDTLLGQVPAVFRRGPYAIPALLAAAITVAAIRTASYGPAAAPAAAFACFTIRMLGVRYNINAPVRPGNGRRYFAHRT